MFSSKRKKEKPVRVETVIGARVQIRGDIEFMGGIHIDGVVEGSITAPDDPEAILIISEHAEIRGDVKVSTVLLNGTVIGDVIATQRVELAEMARVTGNVHYHTMEMMMGAEVNGKLLRMGENGEDVSGSAHEPAAS